MNETSDYTDTVMPMPIYTIAYKCIVSLSQIEEIHDEELLRRAIYPDNAVPPLGKGKRSPFNFLGLRNNFMYWLENTGALKLMNSLDEKLTGMSNVSDTIVELLEVVLANLNRSKFCSAPSAARLNPVTNLITGKKVTDRPCIDISSSTETKEAYWLTWQDAACVAESAMTQLNLVTAEIKTFSARRMELSLTTTLTGKDISFRTDIVALIRDRFPGARQALREQLVESVVTKRLMMLQRNYPTPVGMATSSMAQGPFGMAHDDSFEYPPLPEVIRIKAHLDPFQLGAPQKLTGVECPFCAKELVLRSSDDEINALWIHHINEHIEPYPCLYPQCAKALESFVHREDWVEHMETMHSKDWLRRVHTRTWYCDIGHGSTLHFELESQWREHMLQPHPQYLRVPNPFNLDAYAVRQQKDVLRDEFVCPLCEQIPEDTKQMLEQCHDDSTQAHNSVLNHVAGHLRALSILAVPSRAEVEYNEAVSDKDKIAAQNAYYRDCRHLASLGRQSIDQDKKPDSHSSLPDAMERELHEADVDLQDDTGRTAVSFAAEKGDVDAIQKFCDEFANIELADKEGQSPLLWAAREGHKKIVDILCLNRAFTEDADEIYDRTPILWAASRGHYDVVKVLQRWYANFNAADISNRTALSLAAATGSVDLVWFLISVGADTESTDYEFLRTPLHWAAFENRPGNVRALLQHEAQIDFYDGSFKTPPVPSF
ncbi:hypothetical protein H9Q69_010049 [Fusarium xylarioides]|nr:hypothetical protein H9Q69_010049 [Fusarium xylarioides]